MNRVQSRLRIFLVSLPSWIADMLFPSETTKTGADDKVTVTTTYTGGTYLDSEELYRSAEVQSFLEDSGKEREPAVCEPE
jgi:hypothetical protein